MFDAIVLAGGSARRLGGADKAGLVVHGASLLEHVLAAVGDAGHLIVAGPRRPVPRAVIWCQEQPPGGGPVAAIAAAVGEVRAEVVVVLAADLPAVAPAVLLLVGALDADPRVDCAVLTEPTGRRNHLAAAWRTDILRGRVAALGKVSGAAARALYDGVHLIEIVDRGNWSRDCDTWDDVAAAIAQHLATEVDGE